ncbi:MAG: ArsA family ATPase [Nitriliruptoraceae bacterium]|nr:ArsA family ATPase [Nitriliruptoraceae bacterium]
MAFVGGKGGVGKTTVSAALAVREAEAGRRTLLVSTDPAHSTGDLFGVRLGGAPTAVTSHLDVVEIDAEAQADAYIEAVRTDAHRLVAPAVRDTVDRHLDLARRGAGTLESALVDRLADLLALHPDPYERVVVDTAPTGHTLRLLAMPELVTGWIEGLVRQREKVQGVDRMLRNLAGDEPNELDPVLERLHAQRRRLAELRTRLTDDAVFHAVLIPERLPIEETVRALPAFEEAGLEVGMVVVNRVLPDDADGDFLADRRDQQASYLVEIRDRLPRRHLVEVAQQRRDVTSTDGLAAIVRQLVAADGIRR